MLVSNLHRFTDGISQVYTRDKNDISLNSQADFYSHEWCYFFNQGVQSFYFKVNYLKLKYLSN